MASKKKTSDDDLRAAHAKGVHAKNALRLRDAGSLVSLATTSHVEVTIHLDGQRSVRVRCPVAVARELIDVAAAAAESGL